MKNAKKAVLISASPESSFYDKTLRMIIEKNDFEEFVIVCAACPDILNLTSIESNDENNYEKLKNNVVKWMERNNPKVNRIIQFIFEFWNLRYYKKRKLMIVFLV